MTTTTTTTPRVWIGCLAAYNNGSLHGEWVDATDVDELEEAVTRVLESSPEHDPDGPYGPCEEWFIADHEGFGGYRVGEYEPLEGVATIGALIEEHGDAFGAWLDLGWADGLHVDEYEERFQEQYRGEQSPEDVVAELFDDILGQDWIPDMVAGYVSVDYEGLARDCGYVEHRGHTFESAGY